MKQKFPGVSKIQNGFSLVEMLIVLTLIIFVVVSTSLYLCGHQKLDKPDEDGTGTVAAPKILPVTTAADDEVTAKTRYYSKTGGKNSLADSKAKLPGCSSSVVQTPVATAFGFWLDGSQDGQGANPGEGASRGFTPRPMTDAIQATRING